MAKKKRFVFLSKKFYNTYPTSLYPEMEQKQNRPYIQVYDKKSHCGVDFSKAVVIKDESYIDFSIEPHLRQNEFDALRGKDFKIKNKMEKYIADYKKAKKDLSNPINRMLVTYSTLQYFEKEIGL